MKKRTSLFVILLSALLMVSMMSAMAFAKDKKEAPENGKTENHALKEGGFSVKNLSAPLYVGGVEVQATTTKTEIVGACTSGKAYAQFNEEGTAATLTLDGAVIEGVLDGINIKSKDIDLTIVLNSNNVVGKKESPAEIAVCCYGGNLTIEGTGKLTAEGQYGAIYADEKISVTSIELDATALVAIRSDSDDVEITNAKVTASSDQDNAIDGKNITLKNADVEATSIGVNTIFARGVRNEEGDYVRDGNVTINGGTVKATANGGYYGTDAIYGAGNVTITGADTSVTAVTNCSDEGKYCYGIRADNGKIEISGGNVTATVSGSDLKDCDAIYADEDISITGGDVTATVTGGMYDCDAICAKKGAVDISASKVTASTDNNYAIYGSNVSVGSGSDVTATSDEYEAIVANGGDVTIDRSDVKIESKDDDAVDCYKFTVKDSVVSAKGDGRSVAASDDIDIENSIVEKTEGEMYSDKILKIQDSRINATGDEFALNAGAIDIKNTDKGYSTRVEAEVEKLKLEGLSTSDAGSNYAVRASEDGLSINDLSIILPVNGEVKNYEEFGYKNATVMDGDKPATHVIIEAPKHDITVEETPGGKVKVEPEKAAEGEEVKVIATPDDGYEVEKIVVIGADGKETDITAKGSFTMGKTNVKVRVTFRKKAAPTAKPVVAVKGIAKGKTSLKFTWKKVSGAAKYEIWMSRCNTSKKKYSVKKIRTLDASKTSWTKKNLRKNTGYKFRVVAKDASGKVISKSVICHAYTGNVWGKYTNVKSLKLTKSSYTLKKGGKAKIKAKQTRVRPDKKLCHHAKTLRYKSNNTSVAKVDKNGKITAVGTGECKIYVQTVNGIWKTVKVSVN